MPIKSNVSSCTLPSNALLSRYEEDGHYTDCFSTVVPGAISHQQYVEAFYTTWLFKTERFILQWLASKPSTDAQAANLASGELDKFAAWSVEDRVKNQLLLSDFQGKTRSWLMMSSIQDESTIKTQLYFGSAVISTDLKSDRTFQLGNSFRLLLGLHRLYSVALLRAAARRLGG